MLVYSPKKIIDLRKKIGLNQSELARKSGLSAPSIWALERGETKLPKYETLAAVASALGVPLPAIMADQQPSDIDEQLFSAAKALSPANKAGILAAMQALIDNQGKQ